jgi:hypothetical protein
MLDTSTIETIRIDQAIVVIEIIVGVIGFIVAGTCGIIIWWMRSIGTEVGDLRDKFMGFVQTYYERHEAIIKDFKEFVAQYAERHAELVQHDECVATHSKLDQKVDRLHERQDAIEIIMKNLDRR